MLIDVVSLLNLEEQNNYLACREAMRSDLRYSYLETVHRCGSAPDFHRTSAVASTLSARFVKVRVTVSPVNLIG